MKTVIAVLALAVITMAEPNVQEIFTAANDQFTAKMFNEVVKKNANGNCVQSAFSVLSPLAQLGLASVGESHDEILQAIGMPNDNVMKEVFSDVNTRIRAIKEVELIQANKVYVNLGNSLNDDFAVVSRDVFNSAIQNINFSKSQAAADEINKWVEDHTNQRIMNLLDAGTLTPTTTAVLVNAIYFKGNWSYPFRKESTKDLLFYTNKENTVEKPMMQQTDYFKYGESEDLNAKFLGLEYEGKEAMFVVVLPNEYDGVDALIEKLKDPIAFTKGRKAMSSSKVEVSLPKFRIETKTNLKEVLRSINIKRLFSVGLARLDNLIKEQTDLYVSEAIQKAFIEINEEGTEAAAANYFAIDKYSLIINEVEVKTFNANHPFVFFLLHNDNILFNGVYRS